MNPAENFADTVNMELCKFRKYFILLLCTLFLGLARSGVETIIISEFPEKILHNVTKKKLPDGGTAYAVSDISYQQSADPHTTDLLMSFDRESHKYIKDDSGKYEIYSADYSLVKGEHGIGKGCASFFKSGHGVYIKTSEGLWLGSIEDLGSFNIEFRFNPAQTGNGILFSRTGYLSGVKKGIEFILRNGRVTVKFYNMFRSSDGKLKSVSLARGDVINRGKWHHISVSFDRTTGRLAKFIDGDEEDVIYMTSTGFHGGDVDAPMFGHIDDSDDSSKGTDLPLAIIGKNYIGLIDELRISYTDFDTLRNNRDIASSRHKPVSYAGRTPFNREGVITGEVKLFPTTGTAITDFSWEEVNREGTFIWMELRTADRNFDAHDTSLKWYRVTNSQKGIYRIRGEDSEFLRGKYFQWRAHLVAAPEGGGSPLLKKISISYRADNPPDRPMSIEAAEVGDRYVVLKWKKNVEHDLLGYKIYYGTKKGTYDGIISTINGNRITNSLSGGNYITVKVDNPLIDESRSSDKRNTLVYPTLENTILYYFSVTAYDSYRPDTPYNHESDISYSATARPYSGSEIK